MLPYYSLDYGEDRGKTSFSLQNWILKERTWPNLAPGQNLTRIISLSKNYYQYLVTNYFVSNNFVPFIFTKST